LARRLIIWKTSNRVIGLSVSLSPLMHAPEEPPLVVPGDAGSPDIVVQVALKAWMAGHIVPLATFLMQSEPQPLTMLEIVSDPHRHRCSDPGETVNHDPDDCPVAQPDQCRRLDRVQSAASVLPRRIAPASCRA
jgi:hypothetical protein